MKARFLPSIDAGSPQAYPYIYEDDLHHRMHLRLHRLRKRRLLRLLQLNELPRLR